MNKNNEHQLIKNQNREYRDRLFKAIFGRDTDESREWRLSLYNALNGTNYKDASLLKLNTIENVIYITMKNDVSFLIDSEINLFEQQSSYNPNMPLRGLIYFSQLYQTYLAENDKSLLSTLPVKIPTPRFVVFYNGDREIDDTEELKLSDSFMNYSTDGKFEWTATVININKGHNLALNKKCKALYDYVEYVGRIKSNIKNGMSRYDAIEDAVDWAIAENLLDGFFKRQKAEVLAMCLTEFDEKSYKRTLINDGIAIGIAEGLKKGREAGREQGREEGSLSRAISTAKNLKASGVSIELIAKCTGLSLDEVAAL